MVPWASSRTRGSFLLLVFLCSKRFCFILDFERFRPGNNGIFDILVPKFNDLSCDILLSLFLLYVLQLENIVDASLEVLMCLEIPVSFVDFNSGVEKLGVGGLDIIILFHCIEKFVV
mmetsp:Transcript_288/g.413  ORF Transcript_288/g.413 Transcript_288/m.413 type:complete len:117 (+) Transcript_288:107-457(+)